MKKNLLFFIIATVFVVRIANAMSELYVQEHDDFNISGNRFVVNVDCLTDSNTGLTWARNPDSAPMTWHQAQSYVSKSNLCGYKDWRLPSLKELKSLAKDNHNRQSSSEKTRCFNNKAWLKEQGFNNVQAVYYWSSESYTEDRAYVWNMDLWNGNTIIDRKNSLYYVWQVRSDTASIALQN